MRRIIAIHRIPRRDPGLARLDRLIGDALVAAMLILGFVFCLGAARAETAAKSLLSTNPAELMDLWR
jgi:hypothetical protein